MIKFLHKNQSGLGILQALMVTAAVSVAVGFLMSQMRLSETTLIIPRIRSEMLVAESAFRNMAYMNIIYNCPAGCLPSTASVDAAVANQYLSDFESYLPNCTPAPCGIRYNIGGAKYTYTTDNVTIPGTTLYRLNTIIEYSGTGVSGKVSPSLQKTKINISIVIPEHILIGAPFKCAATPTTPFFRGYAANGNPICHGWAGANSTNGRCDRGYYLKSFDANTMTINCEQLVNANAACAANQYISSVTWNAGSGSVGTTCAARPNAFTYWAFSPAGVAFY